MEELSPNCGVSWSPDSNIKGRLGSLPASNKGKTSVKVMRTQSFQVAGPRLFNCLPKSLRNTGSGATTPWGRTYGCTMGRLAS